VPPDPQQLRIGKTIRAICAGESRPPLSRRLAVLLGCTPEMEHYLLRLNPPRPTFQADATEEEQELMGRHVAYWSDQLERGRIAVFGPVADPEGGYGIAIAAADGESEVRELIAGDPVITDGTGFRYDVYPMPGAISTLQGP
jgi:uncharacterized protein